MRTYKIEPVSQIILSPNRPGACGSRFGPAAALSLPCTPSNCCPGGGVGRTLATLAYIPLRHKALLLALLKPIMQELHMLSKTMSRAGAGASGEASIFVPHLFVDVHSHIHMGGMSQVLARVAP